MTEDKDKYDIIREMRNRLEAKKKRSYRLKLAHERVYEDMRRWAKVGACGSD